MLQLRAKNTSLGLLPPSIKVVTKCVLYKQHFALMTMTPKPILEIKLTWFFKSGCCGADGCHSGSCS